MKKDKQHCVVLANKIKQDAFERKSKSTTWTGSLLFDCITMYAYIFILRITHIIKLAHDMTLLTQDTKNIIRPAPKVPINQSKQPE